MAPSAPDAGEQLCRQFLERKNAHDPQAGQLLAPLPPTPTEPVSEADAERLDAEAMLHQDVHILSVRRDDHEPAASRYVFALDGSVSAERLPVRAGDRTEMRQRSMWKPDIVVEVRDGVIHGVRPQLHEG